MRNRLIGQLEAYRGEAEEEPFRAPMIDLLRSKDNCFYRTCFDPGHVTGSGLLLSRDGQKILLNHHKFLNIWIGFGGHADGEEDIAAVARREVMEESGIADIRFVHPAIFDIDIHAIPANPHKNEPAHKHFDISFLFQVSGDTAFTTSAESHDLKWCNYDEACSLSPFGVDPHMDRMFRKWKKLSL